MPHGTHWLPADLQTTKPAVHSAPAQQLWLRPPHPLQLPPWQWSPTPAWHSVPGATQTCPTQQPPSQLWNGQQGCPPPPHGMQLLPWQIELGPQVWPSATQVPLEQQPAHEAWQPLPPSAPLVAMGTQPVHRVFTSVEQVKPDAQLVPALEQAGRQIPPLGMLTSQTYPPGQPGPPPGPPQFDPLLEPEQAGRQKWSTSQACGPLSLGQLH